MKKLIFIALTLSLFSCSLYESEGRKAFREQGEDYELTSLGSVNNCFLTSDSISQSYTQFIDEELSTLETLQYDYYFISNGSNYTIACERINSEVKPTLFNEWYHNDKKQFWDWAETIANAALVAKEGSL